MAVTERARGKNIGWLLGQAVINVARKLGAKNLWRVTPSEPAINLYYKLGFQKLVDDFHYERYNIQMELKLV